MPRDDPPTPSAPQSPADPAPAAAPDDSLRPRQEAFCQYFVLQGNATHAAQAAGYAPGSCRNQGYRLMRRPAIRARVADIRAGLARAFCLDAVVLMGKLEAVYQRANENHAFNAAARAVEIQARIAGHVSGPKYLQPRHQKTTNDDGGAPNPSGNAAVSGG